MLQVKKNSFTELVDLIWGAFQSTDQKTTAVLQIQTDAFTRKVLHVTNKINQCWWFSYIHKSQSNFKPNKPGC